MKPLVIIIIIIIIITTTTTTTTSTKTTTTTTTIIIIIIMCNLVDEKRKDRGWIRVYDYAKWRRNQSDGRKLRVHRYLGVLEGDDVKNEKVKHLVSEEYNRRLNRMLKSKLNGGNLIKAIKTFAVAAIRYIEEIVKWNKEELDTLDRKTRKRLTAYGGFHPKSDVDRSYVERSKGGRGLLSVKDVVEEEERQLKKYTERSLEDMMEIVRERISFRGDRAEKKERYEAWSEKVIHGQFERQTKEIRSEESWMWLQRGTLKTESLITAAQEQALRTNYWRAKIEKDGTSPLCRMCKQADETVSHIVSLPHGTVRV